IEFFT
uniref:Rubellidin-3.1 n=1 Tax=Litoria rubella TaxID=104895 RepID=RBE31_LITRU